MISTGTFGKLLTDRSRRPVGFAFFSLSCFEDLFSASLSAASRAAFAA